MNSDLAPAYAGRVDLHVLPAPANTIALKQGDARLANMVLMGALVEDTGIVTLAQVEAALAVQIPARYAHLLQANRAALHAGAISSARWNRPEYRMAKSRRFPWRALLITVVALALLLVLYVAPALVLGRPLRPTPLVIAHRGGAARQPENTLAAFRQAVADGVTWLEFDVQMTADGVPVVIHDTDVARTTNGIGPVAELTLAEIQALDAGNGEHVPTLDEVIDYARQQGVSIMPEAKSPELYPGIEAKIVDAVRRAGYTDRTVVQSFSPQALQTLHDLEPGPCAFRAHRAG